MKILITGASNGMGKGVAKALANQNNELILLCRSKESGDALVMELQNISDSNVSLVLCDLTKLSDVKNAIAQIKSEHNFLDGLFINAGIGYAARRIETEDGFDSHFQVNYLAQFMLTLNLLELLENSEIGGRVIFNVTEYGKIFWDDIQLKNKWGFEKAIYQAMTAKRMFCNYLHRIYQQKTSRKISFIGFRIHKTVWTNQINIIPFFMKTMAKVVKVFGGFISIDECGNVMAPLFEEKQDASLKKSGKLFSWKGGMFQEMQQAPSDLDPDNLKKLWLKSTTLLNDKETASISEQLLSHF